MPDSHFYYLKRWFVPGTQRIPKHFGGLTGRKRARREVSKTTEAPGQKQGFGHNLQAPGLLPRLLAAAGGREAQEPAARLCDLQRRQAGRRQSGYGPGQRTGNGAVAGAGQ